MGKRLIHWDEYPQFTAYDPNDGKYIDALEIIADTNILLSDDADIYDYFGVHVSDVQENVSISNGAITGTSKYISSIQHFGLELGHHFIVLHITAPGATTIQASMNPTQQSGLVTLDETGVVIFQMKDDKSQTVKVVASRGNETITKEFTISGMTFGENK